MTNTRFTGCSAGCLLLGCLLLATPAMAQDNDTRTAFSALTLPLQKLVLTWLARDCGASEKLSLQREVLAAGSALDPAFWEAYRLGPPPDILDASRKDLQASFRQRATWLAQEGDKLFGQAEAKRLSQVSEDAYVKQRLDRLAARYKEAALLGLGLVATPDSITRLRTIAENARDPFAEAARRALKQAEERTQQPSP